MHARDFKVLQYYAFKFNLKIKISLLYNNFAYLLEWVLKLKFGVI